MCKSLCRKPTIKNNHFLKLKIWIDQTKLYDTIGLSEDALNILTLVPLDDKHIN